MSRFAPHFGFQRRLMGVLAAARDLATAGPGLRTASYLARGLGAAAQIEASGRPLASPSWRLAVKVAADEAFRTLMIALAHAPTAAELRRIRTEIADAAAMFEDRGWLDDPAGYHREPEPLYDPGLARVRFLGSDYHHLTFESGYQPHAGEPGRDRWLDYVPTRTAHAWVLRHHGRPRPWLVCVHGFRMGWPLADFTAFKAAWLHGALGLNVILPVLPLHGRRKVGRRSGDGFFTAHVLDTVHAEAQAIWDLRRLLGWLRAEGAERIGLYGVSLGAYTSALLSGFEDDLSCVVAGMPTVCFLSLLQRHAPPDVLRAADDVGLCWKSAARAMQVISPLAVAPRVPRERRFLFAGAADRLVPNHHVDDLWKHWQEPELHWLDASHLSFSWDRTINDYVHRVLETSGLLQTPSPRRTRKRKRRAASA